MKLDEMKFNLFRDSLALLFGKRFFPAPFDISAKWSIQLNQAAKSDEQRQCSQQNATK